MKKSQGFTLIELMIVVAIIGIFAAIFHDAYQKKKAQETNVVKYKTSSGNTVFIDCIEGYKFLTSNGDSKQMFDENKQGIRCEKDNLVKNQPTNPPEIINLKANPYKD